MKVTTYGTYYESDNERLQAKQVAAMFPESPILTAAEQLELGQIINRTKADIIARRGRTQDQDGGVGADTRRQS